MLMLMGIAVIVNGYLIIKGFNHSPTVTDVIDGDTIIISSGERVRLLGVNAPEKGRCYYKEAKQRLSTLLLEKNIRLEETRTDIYNRPMGLVYVNNTLINTQMIKEGYGKPDYTKNSQSALFIEAYNEAKEEQLGVNSEICKKLADVPPPDPLCVIKGNIDKATGDHFYHLPTCRHYDQIVLDLDTAEGYFCTEYEAQEAGFILAKDCLR
jgi:hypothetical protein